MRIRTRFETALLIVIVIDILVGASAALISGLTIRGPTVVALALLSVPLVLGLAAALQLTRRFAQGLLLGALFYGLQTICALHGESFVGVNWGLSIRVRVWTEPTTQVFLNLWAATLCVLFLVALSIRRSFDYRGGAMELSSVPNKSIQSTREG
jgi:hypothetical protein